MCRLEREQTPGQQVRVRVTRQRTHGEDTRVLAGSKMGVRPWRGALLLVAELHLLPLPCGSTRPSTSKPGGSRQQPFVYIGPTAKMAFTLLKGWEKIKRRRLFYDKNYGKFKFQRHYVKFYWDTAGRIGLHIASGCLCT